MRIIEITNSWGGVMKGVSFWFMLMAVISGISGMAWGIIMAATSDHSLGVAHGHLNLIGWVGLAVFAFYYHSVPAAAESTLAKVHLAVAVVGLLLVIPGIVITLQGGIPHVAKAGSVVTLLSMLIFGFTILRNRTN